LQVIQLAACQGVVEFIVAFLSGQLYEEGLCRFFPHGGLSLQEEYNDCPPDFLEIVTTAR